MTANTSNAKTTSQRLVEKYGGPPKASLRRSINHAVRSLPGGNDVLDQITRLNELRFNSTDSVEREAYLVGLMALERIRKQMVDHVLDSVGGTR